MQTSMLRVETLTSPPITIQDARVHVRSQVIQLRFPAIHGGVIWNRPVAVVVRLVNGQEETVPIPDVTRAVMLTLAGLCLTGMLVRIFIRRNQTRS
jgi:hypothetical protein